MSQTIHDYTNHQEGSKAKKVDTGLSKKDNLPKMGFRHMFECNSVLSTNTATSLFISRV
jgi:hypothetical protein